MQKLLFWHTSMGDMTPYISDYFDTTSGSKREADSYYSTIAGILCVAMKDVIFVSDLPRGRDKCGRSSRDESGGRGQARECAFEIGHDIEIPNCAILASIVWRRLRRLERLPLCVC